MMSRPAATLLAPTSDGFVLIDKSIRPKEADTVYFEAFGLYQFGVFGSYSIICQDGETLEEVTVVGAQTWGDISS